MSNTPSPVLPDDDVELIETTDEAGMVHYFEKVEEVDFEDKRYAVLIYRGNEQEGLRGIGEDSDDDEEDAAPAHEHGENCAHSHDAEGGYEEEVVLMRILKEDGTDVYEAIEEDEEFNRVLTFIENLEDEDEPEA